MALTFETLYELAEELAQLKSGVLAQVFGDETVYSLGLYWKNKTWFLNIVLRADNPGIFVSSDSISNTKSKSPVCNFLRAHFKGQALENVSIAQKPNRSLILKFSGGGEIYLLLFPHGQQIDLRFDGKRVYFPKHRKSTDTEDLAFVEVEPCEGFVKSERQSQEYRLPPIKKVKAQTVDSSIDKLEKAKIKILDSLKGEGGDEQILTLQKKADQLKLEGGNQLGESLFDLYEEIRDLKSKGEKKRARIIEIENQIENLKKFGVAQEKRPAIKNSKASGPWKRIWLSEDAELWVGKTASGNDELIKAVEPHDLWIHLRDYPGAHGVIRFTKKTEPPDSIIVLACQIVAYLSRSHNKPFADGEKLDLIVVPRKFVKKKKGMAPGKVLVERERVKRISFKIVPFKILQA